MNAAGQAPGTLKAWMSVEVVSDRRLDRALSLTVFVVVMALAARVAVPLPWTGVPMTLQPLVVLLAGVVLGPWPGAAAMAAYLAVGAAGAPVFAMGGGGLAWLAGPTGGYLVAMPAAAFVAGAAWGRHPGLLRRAGALTLGMAALYAGGVSYLLLLTGQDLPRVLAVGVLPFLAGDVIKILLALVLAGMIRSSSLGRR